MRHSASKPLILLSLIAVTGACGDDNDGTNDGAATAEESGSGARSGNSATSGRSSTATTAGRGGNVTTAGRGGNTASAGRSAASGGSSGSSVSVIAGRGAGNAAGRGGAVATTTTTPTAGSGGSAGSAGQAAQVVRDEEIVAILTAANNAEVQQGNVAATKAVSPAVRTYAQDLVNLHTAAQTRLNGVITAANIAPAESATSTDLNKTSSALVTKLQGADLEAFDMTFIQAQIDQHRQVLALIDEHLLPSVKSDVLRSELASTREAVVQHLNRGRAIAVTLELSVDAGPEADAGL